MGAKVVVADVSDEQGEALAREVGAGSLYVPTDCMDEDAIAKAVKATAAYPRGLQISPSQATQNPHLQVFLQGAPDGLGPSTPSLPCIS